MSVEKTTAADITMIKVNGDLSGSNAEELRAIALPAESPDTNRAGEVVMH